MHTISFYIFEQLYGYTPLHVACLYECQRIVQELLKGKLSKPDFVNMKDKVLQNRVRFSNNLAYFSDNKREQNM